VNVRIISESHTRRVIKSVGDGECANGNLPERETASSLLVLSIRFAPGRQNPPEAL
jgi:hypothetical protein